MKNRFATQRSFRNLVSGMENQVLSGLQTFEIQLAPANTRQSPLIVQAEGTDFIVSLIQPGMPAVWGFSVALNEGYKSRDWIRYTDFNIPALRNIPFYQLAFAYDDTGHADDSVYNPLTFRVETNPRVIVALLGGS